MYVEVEPSDSQLVESRESFVLSGWGSMRQPYIESASVLSDSSALQPQPDPQEKTENGVVDQILGYYHNYNLCFQISYTSAIYRISSINHHTSNSSRPRIDAAAIVS